MADKGVTLKKTAVKRISNVVRTVERDKRSQPSTRLIIPRNQRGVALYNPMNEVIPFGAIVWLYYFENNTFMAQKIAYPGVQAFGIASANIGPGQTGTAFVEGMCPVLADETILFNDVRYRRVGLKAGQWCATLQKDVGPMLVYGYGPENGMVWVQLDKNAHGCMG